MADTGSLTVGQSPGTFWLREVSSGPGLPPSQRCCMVTSNPGPPPVQADNYPNLLCVIDLTGNGGAQGGGNRVDNPDRTESVIGVLHGASYKRRMTWDEVVGMAVPVGVPTPPVIAVE